MPLDDGLRLLVQVRGTSERANLLVTVGEVSMEHKRQHGPKGERDVMKKVIFSGKRKEKMKTDRRRKNLTSD